MSGRQFHYEKSDVLPVSAVLDIGHVFDVDVIYEVNVVFNVGVGVMSDVSAVSSDMSEVDVCV